MFTYKVKKKGIFKNVNQFFLYLKKNIKLNKKEPYYYKLKILYILYLKLKKNIYFFFNNLIFKIQIFYKILMNNKIIQYLKNFFFIK